MLYTLKEARIEVKKRLRFRYPHKIEPVYRHAELCLSTSQEIAKAFNIPPHDCTCKQKTLVGYTLVLISKK